MLSKSHDPMQYLGALTIYFFWIALVTGIYLFIFYDTSLSGAWVSVEKLTHDQWYLGGVMRSLHRYASDAAVVTMFLHLARELWRGRFRGVFWFSWLTGVPLIWLVYVFGISGYWMVWDELAAYVAVGSARLMDVIPIFTDPMQRSFLSNDAVNERFFTLIAFIHLVGLPILLVLAIWFHLLRIRLPRINPPRKMMGASLAVLVLVSFVVPAVSHAPADLMRIPAELRIDWFYLAAYPLLDVSSEGVVWTLVTGLSLVLLALPFWPVPEKAPVAEVHLDNCSACGFCAQDCPYGAIDMMPREDGKPGLQAKVNPDLCVSCGICVGACPSATPFRSVAELMSGIEMPDLTTADLKAKIDALPGANTGRRILAFGCDYGVSVNRLQEPDVHAIQLPCVGMLPASFIDYALRGRADAVFIAGCKDCHYRFGDAWLEARIDGERVPALRKRVPRDRLAVTWLPQSADQEMRQALDNLRLQLDGVQVLKLADNGGTR